MSFYYRKSIKVGAFRFNLSKSGVGVSAGIKGLRFGTGPRGNYVHMGRGGIVYRTTIPQLSHPSDPVPSPSPISSGSPPATPTHEELREIESADISRIVDSTSEELLEELNQKHRLNQRWPASLVLTVLLVATGAIAFPGWGTVTVGTVGMLLTAWLYQMDVLRKSVVLFYDFDPDLRKAVTLFHSWAESLAQCARTWHIEASGAVLDRKYHAGASTVVRRNQTTIRIAAPPRVQTNVETISIGVGTQTLHLFPDRLLIYAPNGVGAVNYADLQLSVEPSQFIEEEGVPADAQVVGRTWRYVNKKGGPDQRFKDNPELPICLYERLSLRSNSGLNEIIEVSRTGLLDGFAQAVRHLGGLVHGGSHKAAASLSEPTTDPAP